MENAMRKIPFILLLLISSVLMAATPEDNFNLAQEYFAKSDYSKAKSYYEKVVDNNDYSDRIYENYRTCLVKLKEYKSIEKYLKRRIKSDPTNALYTVAIPIFSPGYRFIIRLYISSELTNSAIVEIPSFFEKTTIASTTIFDSTFVMIFLMSEPSILI